MNKKKRKTRIKHRKNQNRVKNLLQVSMLKAKPKKQSPSPEKEEVKSKITERLEPKFKNRFKVILVPNITNICYGRGVGYKIEEVVLSEYFQKISATKIRKEMRKKGNLK